MEWATWSEIYADQLLHGQGGVIGEITITRFHESGNQIIMLAEQIKAERAIMAVR